MPDAAIPFLRRPRQVWLILGAFFYLTLPVAYVLMGPFEPELKAAIRTGYLWLFGLTHFFITFTIYLQQDNLDYFNSTWMRRIIYFVVPVLILGGFTTYGALGVAALFPVFEFFFRFGIRFVDFLHFSRQAFGVLQVFKGSYKSPIAPWVRKAENALLWAVAILAFETFAYGQRFTAEPLVVKLTLVGVFALVLAVAQGYFVAWRKAEDPKAVLVPAGYLLLNLFSISLAVYDTILYAATLAIHYVEYHLLMAPRTFDKPLSDQGVDRFFVRLRASPVGLYALMLAIGAVTVMFNATQLAVGTDASTARLFALHLFDGLFIFHYFIEAFIWKFSNPFYRKTLGWLYFPPGRDKSVAGGE